ncbi:MAG: TonB-dependent receptor [Candidatus Omnitrophica bacterium]|nr:TonB-dependent receptor [Candidatus Omnitrophota bacterium]MBU4479507.1 TonB-dependent receptor [Candidatus Omnitrophota bacterium]MCG2702984.1 TonB-dependent receptor [Candidatus Omnitrophota bacterium]
MSKYRYYGHARGVVFHFLGVFIIASGFFIGPAVAADKTATYFLEPVVVCPTVLAEYYSNSLRHIETGENCENNGAYSLVDRFRYFSTLDVSRRGVFDVQSDIQMRGAGFEQTDILLNGVIINDPQTGHFNADIPFFPEDMERIVAIAGPAASVNGAGRPGGSVHLVMRKPEKPGVAVKTVFGAHDFSSQTLALSYSLANTMSRTTLGRASCDGYRYNTDFDSICLSHITAAESGRGEIKFLFGWLDKDFGANGFYSEFYPEQKEFTNTVFSSIGLQAEGSGYYINPQVYVRRHNDRYLLNRMNPGFYENLHTNYISGAKIDTVFELEEGKLCTGIDSCEERIKSSSLGKHARLRHTLYSVYSSEWERTLYSCGITGYFYEGFNSRGVPEISAGYRLKDNLKLRSAFSRSFRPPTFTELYYDSPANKGNRELSAEESKNYETGIDYAGEGWDSSLTAFWRREKNLIDWVRTPASTVYQVRNVAHVNTQGIEANVTICPLAENWRKVTLGYAYTDRNEKDTEFISKYVFDYLEHKFVCGSEYVLPYAITAKANLTYLERVHKGGDFVFDSSLEREIKNCRVYLKIDNLFNHAYAEKSNIPMPGRWVFAGIEARW